jgi:hypothetical protein
MKNLKNQLTKEEMRKIAGGVGQAYLWQCQDTATSGFFNICSDINPATKCGEYYCYVTATTCPRFVGCP